MQGRLVSCCPTPASEDKKNNVFLLLQQTLNYTMTLSPSRAAWHYKHVMDGWFLYCGGEMKVSSQAEGQNSFGAALALTPERKKKKYPTDISY